MRPPPLAAFPTVPHSRIFRRLPPAGAGPCAGHWRPQGDRNIRARGGAYLGTIAGWMARAVLLAMLLAPASLAGAPAGIEFSEGQLWGTVRTVVDGCRLTVVTSELVQLDLRLAGVDLPERAHTGQRGTPDLPGQPFGEEAVAYLRGLILDRQVRVDTYGRDPSGRLFGVVWLGEVNVNLALVKEGLAWVEPTFKVTKVRAGLDVAERQAQVGRYGLWGLGDPEAPWEYRKRHGLGSAPPP